MNFLVSKGTKKELDHEDLPSLPEEDHASVVDGRVRGGVERSFFETEYLACHVHGLYESVLGIRILVFCRIDYTYISTGIVGFLLGLADVL